MAIYDRTCRECGGTFKGGPRAWYCPACRAERKRIASRRCKRRRRKGLVRSLGSMDVCEICGKEYEVKGGLQRYCHDCACVVAAETDREQGLAYYKNHKDTINVRRNQRRAAQKEKWSASDMLLMLQLHTSGCTDRQIATILDKKWRDVGKQRRAAIGAGYRHSGTPLPDARNSLGEIAWGKIAPLFGLVPDRTLAALVGCNRVSIERQRKKYGIDPALNAKATRVDWVKWDSLLGTMSDRDLAVKIGCSCAQVFRRRKAAGVASCGQRRGKFDWEQHDTILGTMSDSMAAQIIGCSTAEVQRRRSKLGINPYDGKKDQS